jgi:hypothetical protein
MRTLVAGVTAMAAIMEPTTNADEMARGTLRTAELDI